jgi:hypothetical protein
MPGMPPPLGMPGMPMMGMPMAPPANLFPLSKPFLNSDVKMKAFVWKRVILDHRGDYEVVKNDLRGLDPAWKGIKVIWKDIKENDKFSMEQIQEWFMDKSKPKAVAAETTTVVKDALKTFFPSDK